MSNATTTSNTPTIYLAARNKSWFCNHWNVFAFHTAADRDEFVAYWSDAETHTGNIVKCVPINRQQVSTYVNAPAPFSGEARCVQVEYLWEPADKCAEPFGRIECDFPSSSCPRLSDFRVAS